MGTGECKVAKQSGRKGYFGRVVLQTEPKDDGQITVEFDEQNASRWQSGARFGIDYALEHISKKTFFPRGLRVIVTSIEGHDVDTSSLLIAYASSHALMQALGATVNEKPNLDAEKGLVVFPK